MMSQQRQLGVGLVELMLAILISSFLLIGITEIFSGNKRTYNYQQAQGMANENQRIASVLLTNLLHQIGHLPITNESMRSRGEVFRADTSFSFAAGDTLTGDSSTDPQESITYRYFSGDGIVTCAGDDFGMNFLIAGQSLEFKERTETLSIDANGHLICESSERIGSAAPVIETVVLMGDAFVDPFQRIVVNELIFTYGIDTDNDESVDIYAKAAAVPSITITNSEGNVADTPWQRVKLIKVELEIQSGFRPAETSEYIVFLENLSETQQ